MRSKFTVIMTLFLALFVQFSFAQEKTITGVVSSSEDGLPLIGASVMVQGTTRGTQTDLDGNYSIKASQGEKLVFTYVGMQEQVVAIAASDVINVQLQTYVIDPIVITAYGAQKKSEVVGSFKEVKAQEIQKITAANVTQGLVGKVAGVQVVNSNGMPGESPLVRFRGFGTINASSAPLYVVDGVPYNGDVSAISAADIESMTFLKDAASAALYGNRGANGVIIITTKRGLEQKSTITFDSKTGFAGRAVKEYNKIDSPSRFYEAHHLVLRNHYMNLAVNPQDYDAAGQSASANLINGSLGLGYNIYNVPNNELVDAQGVFNPAAQIKFKGDFNWDDALYGNGLFTQSNFGVRGGNDKTQHFFSVGYDKNDGYVVNSGFERISSRLNLDTWITDKIQVGASAAYSTFTQNYLDGYGQPRNEQNNTYSNPFRWTRYLAPIYPIYQHDHTTGELLNNPLTGTLIYDDGQGVVPRPAGAGQLQNPYATALLDIKKYKVDNIFTSGYFNAELAKGLKFKYVATGELRFADRTSLDTPLLGDAQPVQGRIAQTNSSQTALTQQQLLTYNKNFEGGHNLDVLVGHETLDRKYKVANITRTKLLFPNSDVIDHAGVMESNYGYSEDYALEGYFSRLGYSYDNRYYVSGNVRRDGSSRFHPDNRWGTFFGAGVAWRISQEKFMQDVSWIDELRLKASYGEQGNDNLNLDYERGYTDLYSITPVTDPTLDIAIDRIFKGNKDITWETNINFNAGFEASFFNRRLNVEAEYFKRETKDMLFMRPLPPSSGFNSIPENIGDMENTGFEVTIDGDVIRKENGLRVNLSANFTKFENKITKLPPSVLEGNAIISGIRILREGGSIYDYYIREFAGVNPANGAATFYKDEVDANGNVVGRTTTEDYNDATRYKIDKKMYADIYGGFGINVEYKGIDFGANFAYQFGGYGYDYGYMGYFDSEVGSGYHQDIFNTWTPTNTTATLPRVEPANTKQFYSNSTLGLIKSDFVSLQNLSLGYTFGNEVIKKAGLSGLRVYALADNVALWSKRQGYDPRLSVVGQSSNRYSLLRTISLGVNVQF